MNSFLRCKIVLWVLRETPHEVRQVRSVLGSFSFSHDTQTRTLTLSESRTVTLPVTFPVTGRGHSMKVRTGKIKWPLFSSLWLGLFFLFFLRRCLKFCFEICPPRGSEDFSLYFWSNFDWKVKKWKTAFLRFLTAFLKPDTVLHTVLSQSYRIRYPSSGTTVYSSAVSPASSATSNAYALPEDLDQMATTHKSCRVWHICFHIAKTI